MKINIHSGMEKLKLRVILEKDEEGMFVVECPSLPGCISQGKTKKEALENIKDAIEGYIVVLKKKNEPIPPSTEIEMVEVSV